MLHQAYNYLLHCFRSFYLHGIHSPFIFQFQQDCIIKKNDLKAKNQIIAYRNALKKDKTRLKVQDHGAGSKQLDQTTRQVSDILKHNCTSQSRSLLLQRIGQYFKIKNALELGTSLGVGTHAMAITGAQVTSIEASKTVFDFTKKQLQQHQNVELVNSAFDHYINSIKNTGNLFDLIFIDGHHDGPATLDYFNRLLPYTHNNSLFILDDIYWSSSMTQAWKTLQKHPKVTASIDTFFWGFLFIREEQGQQSFDIKLPIL